MIYVSEIKTITGVYHSFWKVVQEEKKKVFVERLSPTTIEGSESPKGCFHSTTKPSNSQLGPIYQIKKDSHGLYIEGSGKKGMNKTYLDFEYKEGDVFQNIFDSNKLK